MELQVASPCLKQHTIGLRTEPADSSPHYHSKTHFNIIFHLRLFSLLVSSFDV
jgi:hypothetical protein